MALVIRLLLQVADLRNERGASCTKWCLWAIGVCSWLASAAGARPFTQHLDQRGLLPSRCRFISCGGHLASVGSHAQLRSRSRRRQLRETELGGQRLNIWRECYIRGFIWQSRRGEMSIIGLDFLSIYLSVHLSIHPSSYQALCIVCQTAVYLSVNISFIHLCYPLHYTYVCVWVGTLLHGELHPICSIHLHLDQYLLW